MSLQNATAFVQRLKEDSDLSSRLQSKEDAVKVATEAGTPFTVSELEQAIAENSELSSDDLKNAAGGLRPLW